MNTLPFITKPYIQEKLLIVKKASKVYTTPGALFLKEKCPFTFDGITFTTPEQYYKYLKENQYV